MISGIVDIGQLQNIAAVFIHYCNPQFGENTESVAQEYNQPGQAGRYVRVVMGLGSDERQIRPGCGIVSQSIGGAYISGTIVQVHFLKQGNVIASLLGKVGVLGASGKLVDRILELVGLLAVREERPVSVVSLLGCSVDRRQGQRGGDGARGESRGRRYLDLEKDWEWEDIAFFRSQIKPFTEEHIKEYAERVGMTISDEKAREYWLMCKCGVPILMGPIIRNLARAGEVRP